ncbi:MAG TPA: Ldh family oxidoreductase [Hyphomicrobiaceae bacterium]|nr:Ldh family oxidoreductase [Hyphomicrobiaceae bacterium]
MPTIQAAALRGVVEKLLSAAGASPEEAGIVARHSVAANLAGHDSHGVIQIPIYIDRIDKGHIVPGAKFEIKQESATTTVVDGHWGFGYVVSERATKMTIEKAKTSNVAATTIFRQSHIGRVAAYPLMAAREGMIAIMTADSGRGPKHVAPFGGSEARLGTNPICIAVPADLAGPFVVDMATSAVAAGKIKLAQAQGISIPEGWVIDANGNPTTNPHDYGKGGVLLPLGGPEGHKGYGLSAMVEILSALLPGLGFGVEPTGRHNDGCFLACFNVEAFRPIATFKKEVAEFAAYLKDTKPAAGFEEVLYPGEIELRREEERNRDGIVVDDKTWSQLMGLGDKFGIRDQVDVIKR